MSAGGVGLHGYGITKANGFPVNPFPMALWPGLVGDRRECMCWVHCVSSCAATEASLDRAINGQLLGPQPTADVLGNGARKSWDAAGKVTWRG